MHRNDNDIKIPPDLMVGMTAQHVAFAKQFAITDNATQSARDAGYAKSNANNTGSRLKKIDDVEVVVSYIREALIGRVEVDVDYILSNLQTVIKEGMKPLPLKGPGGRESGHSRMADAPSAVRALELLGRYQSMWDGEVKVDQSRTLVLGDTALTGDKWDEMAEKYLTIKAVPVKAVQDVTGDEKAQK